MTPDCSFAARLWPHYLLCWAFIVFVVLQAIIIGIGGGLLDTDYHWQLRTGDLLLETWSLPDGDPFSHSMAGKPWTLHEWLFEIILALVYRIGGTPLVLFATALIAGSALFVGFLLADRWLKSPLLSLALTLGFSSVYYPFVVPRPHLISFLFTGLLLHCLWSARYEGRLRFLIIPPVLMIFWVNLHGGYVVGLAIMIAFFCLEGLRLYLASAISEARPYLKALAASSAAMALASLVNPYGINHLLYPFDVMAMDINNFIREWTSFDFHDGLSKWYLLVVLSFIALMVARSKRPDVTELAIPLMTMAAAFVSMRHAPIAILLFIGYGGQALVNGADAPIRTAWQKLFPAASKHLSGLMRKAAQLPRSAATAASGGLAAVIMIGALISSHDAAYEEKVESKYAGLVDFIDKNRLQGRMFNEYGIGGLLIRRLYPHQKVYIDGRADLYGADFIRRYLTIANGKSGWREVFDAGHFDYVICSSDSVLAMHMETHPDYQAVFEDEGMRIYVSARGRNASLIERAAPAQ